MLKKGKRILLYILITLAAALAATFVISRMSRIDATAYGTVNSGEPVEVHRKASEDSGAVTRRGEKMYISNGTRVAVVKGDGDWYLIRYRSSFGKISGYVLKKYIIFYDEAEDTSSSEKTFTGEMSADASLYTGASTEASVVYDGDEQVNVYEGTLVKVSAISFNSGMKWYKILYDRKGNPYEGYVNAQSVDIKFNNSVTGYIYTSDYAAVYSEMNSTKPLSGQDGTEIQLSHGTEVKVKDSDVSDGIRYNLVSFNLNGTDYAGYVNDDFLILSGLDVEAVAEPTPVVYDPDVTVRPRKKPVKKVKKVVKVTSSPVPDSKFKRELVKEGFPEAYLGPLVELHKKYPYWRFEAYDTGLYWSDALQNESTVGLNLVPVSKPDTWKSKEPGAYDPDTGAYTAFDSTTWVSASREVIAYYMDPRNFLNSTQIFQFENLSYQDEVQNLSGMSRMLKGTPMYGSSFNYREGGKTNTISYAKAFMDAAEKSGVSPYHLAARVKQEVVTSSTSFSSSVTNGTGYYNFYNIGASNSPGGGAVAKGLSYARGSGGYMRPWNNRYRAIVGGGIFIGENYINVGQNTEYFQKFNVTHTATYGHQYMGNLEAPAAEAVKTATAYGDSIKSMDILFTIPIYKNMPTSLCRPPKNGTVTGKVRAGRNPSGGAQASGDSGLTSITIRNLRFSKRFMVEEGGARVFTYRDTRGSYNVIIGARPSNSEASVTGTGRRSLNPGVNSFYLVCRAGNGTKTRYKINIIVSGRKTGHSSSGGSESPDPGQNGSGESNHREENGNRSGEENQKNESDNSNTGTGSAVR